MRKFFVFLVPLLEASGGSIRHNTARALRREREQKREEELQERRRKRVEGSQEGGGGGGGGVQSEDGESGKEGVKIKGGRDAVDILLHHGLKSACLRCIAALSTLRVYK